VASGLTTCMESKKEISWHQEFAHKLRAYGLTQEQASEVLGYVIELALRYDNEGFCRGFEDGLKEVQYKKLQARIEELEAALHIMTIT